MAIQGYLSCAICAEYIPATEELAARLSGKVARRPDEELLEYLERLTRTEFGLHCSSCDYRLDLIVRDIEKDIRALVAEAKAFLRQDEIKLLKNLIEALKGGAYLSRDAIKWFDQLAGSTRLRIAQFEKPVFYRGGNPESGSRSG